MPDATACHALRLVRAFVAVLLVVIGLALLGCAGGAV